MLSEYSTKNKIEVASKLFFWMIEVRVDGTFFAFTGGSGLVTFLTLKLEIENSVSFVRILWWERIPERGAPCSVAENHVVWRNFPLNRKISNDWLRSRWNSIWYPLPIAESSSRKEVFLIADLRKFLSSFKFNCWVSKSKGDIYNCRTEAILSSFLPWNCYAENREIMNAEQAAGRSSSLHDFS